MTVTNAFTDSTPGGDSTTPKVGDLSGAITVGSTDCFIRFTNTGDDICNLYWRKTGTTNYDPVQLTPATSQDRLVSLTAARTMEYYFTAGILQVDVVYFWGASGIPVSVGLSDVEAILTAYGYTISASGDMTSEQVQLFLNRAAVEVTWAAARYAKIANHALNTDVQNTIIKDGAVAHALRALENKGASRGYQQQSQRVSDAERAQIVASYNLAIMKIESGNYYGA